MAEFARSKMRVAAAGYTKFHTVWRAKGFTLVCIIRWECRRRPPSRRFCRSWHSKIWFNSGRPFCARPECHATSCSPTRCPTKTTQTDWKFSIRLRPVLKISLRRMTTVTAALSGAQKVAATSAEFVRTSCFILLVSSRGSRRFSRHHPVFLIEQQSRHGEIIIGLQGLEQSSVDHVRPHVRPDQMAEGITSGATVDHHICQGFEGF